MKKDKDRLNVRLEIAYEMCENESTEYMLQILEDTVNLYNERQGTKFDSYSYVMEWLHGL